MRDVHHRLHKARPELRGGVGALGDGMPCKALGLEGGQEPAPCRASWHDLERGHRPQGPHTATDAHAKPPQTFLNPGGHVSAGPGSRMLAMARGSGPRPQQPSTARAAASNAHTPVLGLPLPHHTKPLNHDEQSQYPWHVPGGEGVLHWRWAMHSGLHPAPPDAAGARTRSKKKSDAQSPRARVRPTWGGISGPCPCTCARARIIQCAGVIDAAVGQELRWREVGCPQAACWQSSGGACWVGRRGPAENLDVVSSLHVRSICR